MRIRLFACLCIATLAVCASRTRAEGINLYWNDCSPFRGGGGVTGITNDCTSNNGSLVLIASFVPQAGITGLVGVEGTILLTLGSASVPAWWQMQPTGCRSTSLSISFQYPGLSACARTWSGSQEIGGFAYDLSPLCCPAPYIARLRMVGAVAPSDSVAISPSTEYYAFEIFINQRKSVGVGSCDGCATAACIELRSIQLSQANRPTAEPAITQTDQNKFVTYNGAHVGDCAYVPVRNSSWGALKAIYR
jgi:hypothetical protein